MVKYAVFCYIDRSMTKPATLPLSHCQLFQTCDVDEARECVARIFCPHGLPVAHPGTALDARHHSVRLHQAVSLNYVQYGPAVRIDPGYLGDFYLLQIPLRGGAPIRCGQQQVLADTCTASLPSPTEALSMEWADDSPHLIVRFSRQALQRQFEQLAQMPMSQPLMFDLAVPLNAPALAPVLNFVHYLCATVDADPALCDTVLAAQAEAYLLTSLLTLAPHNHSACLQPGARRSLLPRSVRRAQEYLHNHVTAPLSLADLCQQLGVGARALQQAFRQHTGRSPMAYWRDLRLDHVHAVLARFGLDDKASVSQVAAQYGFLHLGHFAAQYQARFGELPMRTLRTGSVSTH